MKKIIKITKYFAELLVILKEINQSLKSIARCVKENRASHGGRYYIMTGHWNHGD